MCFKRQRKIKKAYFFLLIWYIMCIFKALHFIWSFCTILRFPLSFILPVQTCRYHDNITALGSNVNVITDTCNSHEDPSILNARLSCPVTCAGTWIYSENLMLLYFIL